MKLHITKQLFEQGTSQVSYKKQNSKTSSRTTSVNQPEPSDELAIQIDSSSYFDFYFMCLIWDDFCGLDFEFYWVKKGLNYEILYILRD